MQFPPVWLDDWDFGDIKEMISIQNEYTLHFFIQLLGYALIEICDCIPLNLSSIR